MCGDDDGKSCCVGGGDGVEEGVMMIDDSEDRGSLVWSMVFVSSSFIVPDDQW